MNSLASHPVSINMDLEILRPGNGFRTRRKLKSHKFINENELSKRNARILTEKSGISSSVN